jgi:hypothetical protein
MSLPPSVLPTSAVNNDGLMNKNSSSDNSYHITVNIYHALGQAQYHSGEVPTRIQSPNKTFNPLDNWCCDLLESNSKSNNNKTTWLDPSDSKDHDFDDNAHKPSSLDHHEFDDDDESRIHHHLYLN